MVYAAQTRALAVLETAAHLDDAGLPQNRFLVRIEVPDDVWQARQTLGWEFLPAAWCAVPAGRASIEIGSAWVRSLSSALLLVPSVVIREEFAVLINAAHPHAQRIRARTIRAFEFNKLFREPDAPERLEPKFGSR